MSIKLPVWAVQAALSGDHCAPPSPAAAPTGGARAAGQVLLDPYAHAVVRRALPEGFNLAAPRAPAGGAGGGLPPAQPVNAPALLGSLAPLADGGEEGADVGLGLGSRAWQPRVDLEGAAVLELDVASFAAGDDVAPERHGKFLGVLDRCAASAAFCCQGLRAACWVRLISKDKSSGLVACF